MLSPTSGFSSAHSSRTHQRLKLTEGENSNQHFSSHRAEKHHFGGFLGPTPSVIVHSRRRRDEVGALVRDFQQQPGWPWLAETQANTTCRICSQHSAAAVKALGYVNVQCPNKTHKPVSCDRFPEASMIFLSTSQHSGTTRLSRLRELGSCALQKQLDAFN